jgi:hypothetical protein
MTLRSWKGGPQKRGGAEIRAGPIHGILSGFPSREILRSGTRGFGFPLPASLDQCACEQPTIARAIPCLSSLDRLFVKWVPISDSGADSGEARRLIPPSSDDPAAASTTYITYITYITFITSIVAKK